MEAEKYYGLTRGLYTSGRSATIVMVASAQTTKWPHKLAATLPCDHHATESPPTRRHPCLTCMHALDLLDLRHNCAISHNRMAYGIVSLTQFYVLIAEILLKMKSFHSATRNQFF